MSRPVAPRGGPRGPRQAPAPRSGGGAHGPNGPRDPGRRSHAWHVRAEGYVARELPERAAAEAPVPVAAAPPAADPRRRLLRDTFAAARRDRAHARELRREERAAAAELREAEAAAARAEPPGELSGLRLLLDQLDALLRDPTLALALRRFTDKLAGGLRDLAKAIRLPRLRLPHIPRWLLLLPLLLLLALGIPALLSSGDDDRRPGAPSGAELALPGVGMPALQAAPDDPPPARVALVVDDTYAPAALRRELRSLGTWLAANHAPGTRVSVIDATTGRASAPLSAADLARGAATRAQPGTDAAIRSALAGGGRRLLVNVGARAPASTASTLTVAPSRGARPPARVPLRRGERAQVRIDARRPDALAASVARALIAISGQSERR